MDQNYDRNPVEQVIGIRRGTATNTYAYDDAGRLIQISTTTTRTYAYDAAGNRVSDSSMPGGWSYDNMNRLTNWPGGGYGFDGEGCVTSRVAGASILQFECDLMRNIVAVRDGSGTVIARYGYDPSGRRVRKEVNGQVTWYLYSDEGLIGEYDETGAPIREYGYKPGGDWMLDPLYLKQGNAYYFYLNNHLGAPERMLDESGAVVWTADYDDFGRPIAGVSNSLVNPLVLSGQYRDEETGLHYNTQRYYDPLTGRYLAPDKLGLSEDLNLYLFAADDPVNMVDATGLYGMNMHFYMTYMLARQSGMPEGTAMQLAIWAQYPDAESKLNASSSLGRRWAPWDTDEFSTKDWMVKVQSYLHQLSGDNPRKRVCVRETLKAMISNEHDLAKQGMLLHAFEDTYAHLNMDAKEKTWEKEGAGYDPGFGHGGSFHRPDLIALRPWLAKAAVTNVFDALTGGKGDASQLTSELATIDQIGQFNFHWNEGAEVDKLKEIVSTPPFNMNTDHLPAIFTDYNGEKPIPNYQLSDDQIRDFVNDLKHKIDCSCNQYNTAK